MIHFPKFNGKAEKFQEPVYILERWYFNDKCIYIYFKVTGYTGAEELTCVYAMVEMYKYYTLSNDLKFDTYFRDDETRCFSLISKEGFDAAFNYAISQLKEI